LLYGNATSRSASATLRIEGFDCFRSGQRTDAGELFGRAAKTRPFQSPQAVRFKRRIKNEVCAAKSSVCAARPSTGRGAVLDRYMSGNPTNQDFGQKSPTK
jgi:hypothetical protein